MAVVFMPRDILKVILRIYILSAKTSRDRVRESRPVRLANKWFCTIYDSLVISMFQADLSVHSTQWHLASRMIFYKDQKKSLSVNPLLVSSPSVLYAECQLLKQMESDLEAIVRCITVVDQVYLDDLLYNGRAPNFMCGKYKKLLQLILAHYAHRIAVLIFDSSQRVWSYSITLEYGTDFRCTLYSELFYPEKTCCEKYWRDNPRERIMSNSPLDTFGWRLLPIVKVVTESLHLQLAFKRRVFHVLRTRSHQSVVSNKRVTHK